MIPYLTAQQLHQALPYPALIDALRLTFQSDMQAPKRHVHHLPDADTTLLLMPAWQAGAKLGVKLVTVAPANPSKNLPTVHSIFLLFDATTGAPLALLDGEELTLRRTAAASALASGYLSRAESETLLLVGTGSLAPYLAEAHCAVRPIRRVLVWGRSPQRAEQAAQELRAQAWANTMVIEVAANLHAASAEADIISCATTSTVPLVCGSDVRPGTHIDLVGGFKPNMREADDDLMARATVFVDTFAGALAEAGDLVQPLANGRLQRAAIVAELADLASSRHAGRGSPEEVSVFKSVGTALEDLCAANLAWENLPAKRQDQ